MQRHEEAPLSRQARCPWPRATPPAPDREPAPRADEVRRLVDYIHENYAEPISLRDLNRLSALTVFQIIRAFRREVGTTPHAYLIAVRVDRAAARLASGETIAGAAAAAGFADQSHLGRHFKRRFGKTPREFAGGPGPE
jgi:AraC-like DNA-binding protein